MNPPRTFGLRREVVITPRAPAPSRRPRPAAVAPAPPPKPPAAPAPPAKAPAPTPAPASASIPRPGPGRAAFKALRAHRHEVRAMLEASTGADGLWRLGVHREIGSALGVPPHAVREWIRWEIRRGKVAPKTRRGRSPRRSQP